MTEIRRILESQPLFSGLDPEGFAALEEQAREVSFEAGEIVFREDEPGGELYLVLEGAVEFVRRIGDDLERTLATAREGAAIGVLSALDGGDRPGTARAAEATRALALDKKGLEAIHAAAPASGYRLIQALAGILGRNVRGAVEQMEVQVAWSLKVGGAAELNLDRLVSDCVEVSIGLVDGNVVSGRILKVEASAAGHEIYLETAEGLAVVPYRAVTVIRFPSGDLLYSSDLVEA